MSNRGGPSAGFYLGLGGMVVGFLSLTIRAANREGQLPATLSDLLVPGGVCVAILGFVFFVMALFAAGARKRNAQLEARPDVEHVFSALRNAGTVQGLRKLHAGNDHLPVALPSSYSVALEPGGVSFWVGLARAPRHLGHIPWNVVTGVRSTIVSEGLTSFPGVVFDVVPRADETASMRSLPMVLRGGPAGIGAAADAARLAGLGEQLRRAASGTISG